MFFTILTILIIAFFAITFTLYRRSKAQKAQSNSATGAEEIETLQSRSLRFKRDFKLMSYKEALKASMQFLYDITRIVVQKFTVNDRNASLDAGKKLFKNGVEYMHTIDIVSLSMQKHSEVGISKSTAKKVSSSGIGK